ncbi:MAG: winged helix-turn-helix transcriptional regulator [Lentisphaeria bacterium]|nr:winged helix-turn-helix transcriptional regulator [Lentisphaeria bacterium]
MLAAGRKSTLTDQLAAKIRADIRGGILKPGDKLPSERVLAQSSGICRVTVISALNRLENEGLIERVPLVGSFVREHDLPIKIALVCPSAQLGQLGDAERTFSFFEFHRGGLAEAIERGVGFGVECIPLAESEKTPRKFFDRLAGYDSLIFPTEAQGELRQMFYGKKRMVVRYPRFFSEEDRKNCIYLSYDQRESFASLLRRAAGLGWKKFSLVMLEDTPWFRLRRRRFLEAAEALGLTVDVVDLAGSADPRELLRCRGTFVFCNHTILLPEFYKKCAAAGLTPGEDFGLAGLCSGFTLTNLDPAPGYIKIPLFELGREAMRSALGLSLESRIVPAPIIDGRTIRKFNA